MPDPDAASHLTVDGTRVWTAGGLLHRDGGLGAVQYPDATRMWYRHGLIHRDCDEPAVIDSRGSLQWRVRGLLNRDADRPAYIGADGTRIWFRFGYVHRIPGPAVLPSSGRPRWFLRGMPASARRAAELNRAWDATAATYPREGDLLDAARDPWVAAVLLANGAVAERWLDDPEVHQTVIRRAEPGPWSTAGWGRDGWTYRRWETDDWTPGPLPPVCAPARTPLDRPPPAAGDRAMIDPDGNAGWQRDRRFHREAGPALILHGSLSWYRDAALHRIDGPAVIEHDGALRWYVDGKEHRLLGPSWEGADGERRWSDKGQRHRDGDQPAVTDRDGQREWWVKGQRHREGGPAVVTADGTREWWVHGQRHRNDDLPAITDRHGRREWWVHGQRHRLDGPAVIDLDVKRWYVWDVWQRSGDLPAAEHTDGTREWAYRGRLHRLTGPAQVWPDGTVTWWWLGTRPGENQQVALTRAWTATDHTYSTGSALQATADGNVWVAAVLLSNPSLTGVLDENPDVRANLNQLCHRVVRVYEDHIAPPPAHLAQQAWQTAAEPPRSRGFRARVARRRSGR